MPTTRYTSDIDFRGAVSLESGRLVSGRIAMGKIGSSISDATNTGAVTAAVLLGLTPPESLRTTRFYRVTVRMTASITVASDAFDMKVIDGTGGGATQLDITHIHRPGHTNSMGILYVAEFQPSTAISYLYARIDRRSGGTGNISVFGATIVSRLTLEDLGAA